MSIEVYGQGWGKEWRGLYWLEVGSTDGYPIWISVGPKFRFVKLYFFIIYEWARVFAPGKP